MLPAGLFGAVFGDDALTGAATSADFGRATGDACFGGVRASSGGGGLRVGFGDAGFAAGGALCWATGFRTALLYFISTSLLAFLLQRLPILIAM